MNATIPIYFLIILEQSLLNYGVKLTMRKVTSSLCGNYYKRKISVIHTAQFFAQETLKYMIEIIASNIVQLHIM